MGCGECSDRAGGRWILGALKREREVMGQGVLANPVERGKGAETLGFGVIRRAGRAGANCGNHEVFRGVLCGDEFEYLGLVTGPLQELGAEGVGDELGLPLLENAVTQRVGEDGRRGELRAELLLAAR